MQSAMMTLLLIGAASQGWVLDEGSTPSVGDPCPSIQGLPVGGPSYRPAHHRPVYYSAEWRAANYGPIYQYRTQFDYPWSVTPSLPQGCVTCFGGGMGEASASSGVARPSAAKSLRTAAPIEAHAPSKRR